MILRKKTFQFVSKQILSAPVWKGIDRKSWKADIGKNNVKSKRKSDVIPSRILSDICLLGDLQQTWRKNYMRKKAW
jgi:hypothetical protein